jgi:6-phosphogluconolactonase
MEKYIVEDSAELSVRVADWFLSLVNNVLQKQDRFTVALSGGSTPKKLFALLATDDYKNRIDWTRVHCFWGDERFVPFADDRNNAKMAYEQLLNHVPVRPEHIHIMPTEMEPPQAVAAYTKIIDSYFKPGAASFDLVMLGLGDNAHTLSLFPGYPIIHEKEKTVDAFYLKEQEMYRITLTAPIVNLASNICFIVAGADKSPAVREIIEGEWNPDLYPAQVIKPVKGKMFWFMDAAAAAELSL